MSLRFAQRPPTCRACAVPSLPSRRKALWVSVVNKPDQTAGFDARLAVVETIKDHPISFYIEQQNQILAVNAKMRLLGFSLPLLDEKNSLLRGTVLPL